MAYGVTGFMVHRVLSAQALCLCLALAFDAAAQGEGASGEGEGAAEAAAEDSAAAGQDANALFQEGRTLMTAGLFDQACPKFEAALKLKQGVGVLLNLADCYDRIGRTASAWTTYSQAHKLAEEKNDDRAELAAQRAKALEPRLLKLTVIVPSESTVPGLEVLRDGVPIDEPFWGTDIPVDPGAYIIEARAPGRLAWSRRVSVTAASASITVPPLEVDPAAAPAEKERPDAAREEGLGTQRVLALVAGGAGIVGVGVGAVFGVVSMSKHNEAEESCASRGGQYVCDQAGFDAADAAIGAGNISTIGFIAGGVLLAAGAVLWITAPSSQEAPRVGVGPGRVLVRGAF